MNSQDQNKFKELITVISETYGEEFNPSKVKLWWNLFKPYSIEVFEKALYAHIACPDAGMFSPKPANLMKIINGTTKEHEQAIKDKSTLAWAAIMRDISRVGPYGNLQLEDKKALAAVESIGGWQMLCSKTYDELNWIEKQFKEAYDMYERTPDSDLPKQLKGIVSSQQQGLPNHTASNDTVQALNPPEEIKRRLQAAYNSIPKE